MSLNRHVISFWSGMGAGWMKMEHDGEACLRFAARQPVLANAGGEEERQLTTPREYLA